MAWPLLHFHFHFHGDLNMSRMTIGMFLLQDYNKLASVDDASLLSALRRSQWLAGAFFLAACASFFGGVLFAASLAPGSHALIAHLSLGISGATLAFMFACCFFLVVSEALEPLSKNQSLCVEALACANASAAASAWRDRALASGRELRRFDLRAMKSLLEAEQGEKACRQLHRVET
jgi:hypothetical protein